jgi:hypothetical protein
MSRWFSATFVALALGSAAAPAAAVFVEQASATLRWAPAEGPVAAYGVWIRRDGAAYGSLPDLWVAGPEITVRALGFEQVVVRTAAFDQAGRRGPFSPDSEPIIFLPPPEEAPAAEPARPFDLDGDGVTDLLWRSALRDQLLMVRLAADLTPADLTVLEIDPGDEVVGSADFDADGRADLLIRTGAAGRHCIWFMDGFQVRVKRDLPVLPEIGTVTALADFDGDGRTDLLWRDAGQPGSSPLITYLQDGAIRDVEVLDESDLPSTAAPDLDGDGAADLLLYDAPARASEARLLGDEGAPRVATLDPPPWPNAELVGWSDIDADGDDDLLWQLPGAGGLRLWFMDDFDARVVLGWTYADTQYVHSLGDYDGDGRADDALIRDAVTARSWIGRFDWNGVSEAAAPVRTPIFSPGPGWIPLAN